MIINITKENSFLLEEFIKNNSSNFFRYFDSRTVDIMHNHVITIVKVIDNKTVGYGHIDEDQDSNLWIGLSVLDDYQRKGYGKELLNYLVSFSKSNQLQNVQLTVDIDNYKALNLYLKYGFVIDTVQPKYYLMKLKPENNITLPVSTGEAVDKLTILEIKLKKITDQTRLVEVRKEFNALKGILKDIVNSNLYYYNLLLQINESIWDMQDTFRHSNNVEEKNRLCMEIIEDNDRRFRLKNKINTLAKSVLKEQKGYNKKKAFVLTHLGLGDNITAIGLVRYLSTKYDEVLVVVKNNNKSNMAKIYEDDQSIFLYGVDQDEDISPKLGCDEEHFKRVTEGYDLYLTGLHKLIIMPNRSPTPFHFYDDLKVDCSVFWNYFHVPDLGETLEEDYLVIHNSTSWGEVFKIEDVEEHAQVSRDDIIFISLCRNIYPEDHKFYSKAEQFVFKPLIQYKRLIENAKAVYLSDSSIFCMALNLKIKTDNCFYRSRDGADYQPLYKPEYGYRALSGKRRFRPF